MAYISFTDGLGAALLVGYRPATVAAALVGRFRNWVPATRVIGDSATALGTGALHVFRYRTDYGATFELPGISAHFNATQGNVPLEVADRLVAHLLGGGTCTVVTEDNAATSYVCGLMPETTPQIAMTDPALLEYTLSLAVIRQDGTAAPMTCRYGRIS